MKIRAEEKDHRSAAQISQDYFKSEAYLQNKRRAEQDRINQAKSPETVIKTERIIDTKKCTYSYRINLNGYKVSVQPNLDEKSNIGYSRRLNLQIGDVQFVSKVHAGSKTVGYSKILTEKRMKLRKSNGQSPSIDNESSFYAMDDTAEKRLYHIQQTPSIFQASKNLPLSRGGILKVSKSINNNNDVMTIQSNAESADGRDVLSFNLKRQNKALGDRYYLTTQQLKSLFEPLPSQQLAKCRSEHGNSAGVTQKNGSARSNQGVGRSIK